MFYAILKPEALHPSLSHSTQDVRGGLDRVCVTCRSQNIQKEVCLDLENRTLRQQHDRGNGIFPSTRTPS